MAQKDTVTSILIAAEELFSERGFAETSLRNITTRAGVNLAAVNYHFGSKKSLIQAVFSRFLDPFCDLLEGELLMMSKQLPEHPPTLERLLNTISRVALKSGQNSPKRLAIFMRLLGLAYTQGQGHLRKYLNLQYGHVFSPFRDMLRAAAPHLTDEEIFWRIHFMLGATIFTMSGLDALTAIAEHDLGKEADIAQIIDKLIPFVAAGLNAS